MTSKERQDLCTLLEKNTSMTWWVNENEQMPYYTAECEKIKFKQDFEISEELRMFIKGVSIGYLVNAMQMLNEKLDAEKAKAKRKRLTSAFNPWKFCGKDKMHPQFMYCHIQGGMVEASDCHTLIQRKFDYPNELEGKLVDDDMKPSTEEYRFPDVNRVFYAENDPNCIEFTLEHDAKWFAQLAKQMKGDEKRGINAFAKIGGLTFRWPEVERIAYWLQYNTPTKCVFQERKYVQMECPEGRLLSISYIIGDEESPIIYE